MKTCQSCKIQMEHDWEVYGAIGDCLCVDCYHGAMEQEQGYREWYGLAPHGHDMSRTGSIIGSTVFKPLPDTKDEHGWYELGEGEWFWPDSETGPEMGITRQYHDVSEKPDYPYLPDGIERDEDET